MSKAKEVIEAIESLSVDEAIDDNESMAKALEKAIQKSFPDSRVEVSTDGPLGSKDPTIRFTFGKDKSEYPNGIVQNDPLFHLISFDGFSKDGKLSSEKVKVEMQQGGSFRVNGQPLQKFKWRNGKMKPEAAVKKVEKYFSQIKDWLSSSDGKEAVAKYKERLK